MGSVANLVMRKNSTLTDEDMLHLKRHGRAVEESEGRLEILNTFRGPALQLFMRDGATSRALVGVVALDRAVGATVADEGVRDREVNQRCSRVPPRQVCRNARMLSKHSPPQSQEWSPRPREQ